MSTSPRIGLFGGTFDPPHLGHLVVAEEARIGLDLDEIRFVVAGQPWMKRRTAEGSHRVRMVELATAGNSSFTVDDREIRRDGPTYTADTLEELRREQPDAHWVFLLGADAAQKAGEWHRIDDAVAMAEFVVLSRPGFDAPVSPPLDPRARLEVTAIDISSTDLRERFRTGGPVRYQVVDEVERYVREQDLYAASTESSATSGAKRLARHRARGE